MIEYGKKKKKKANEKKSKRKKNKRKKKKKIIFLGQKHSKWMEKTILTYIFKKSDKKKAC
jgi:hypothetical protein